MDTIAPSTGSPAPNDSDQSLQQELRQVRAQQAQLYSQMQAQMLKEAKGPSTFRKILGTIAGAAANVFAPGLGGAIGSMVTGNQSNSVNNLVTLNAMNTFATNAGLAGSLAGSASSANIDASNAALQEANTEHLNTIQQELAEIAGLPKGPDPVSFLALAEKTNTESEIFQATTAIAKAKHEAAMAAIQNIKD